MRIAWGRITQSIDLRPSKTVSGFSEERFAFFKEMVKRGHIVKVMTDMTKDSEKLLNDVKMNGYKLDSGIDVSWMAKLEYAPGQMCDGSEDALVFESGPPNCMFAGGHCGGLPLFHCAKVIGSFKKGPVFLSQNDPDLAFPLRKYAGCKINWDDPENIFNICTKNNTYPDGKYDFKKHKAAGVDIEKHGWGNRRDFFTKNKTIVLMSKSSDIQSVIDGFDGGVRSGYSEYIKTGKLQVASMPTVYSFDYVLGLGFNYTPDFDVIYTGYPRNREKSFQELFINKSISLRMALTGPWKDKDFADLGVNMGNTCYLGRVPGFASMPLVTNRAKCALVLAVPRAKKFAWVTSRHLEAVFSGAIVLYDAAYKCMDEYFDVDFSVRDHSEAIRKFHWIRKLSNEDRYRVWRHQFEKVKNHNWQKYCCDFEKLCLKYGVEDAVKEEYRPVPRDKSFDNIEELLSSLRETERKSKMSDKTKKMKKAAAVKTAVTKAEKTAAPKEKRTFPKKTAVAPDAVVTMKVPKAIESVKEFFPETGTRFRHGSARQLAFETVLKAAKAGKNITETRAALSAIRTEDGAKYDLDASYANFVIAAHPEFLSLYGDGSIKVIGEPKVDANAAATAASKIKGAKEKKAKAANLRKVATDSDSVKTKVAKVEKKDKSDKKDKKAKKPVAAPTSKSAETSVAEA